MAYSAGTAYLEIVPSFLNLESMVANGARDIARALDKSLGAQLGKSMRNAARSADGDTARAAQVLGRTFADNAMKNVDSAISRISENDRILAPLRKELVSISEIDITKGFDEKDFIARVERAHAALRKVQQDAQGKNAVGRFTNAGNAAQDLSAVKDIVEAARKRGFAAGDAFSDAYQSRLKAMDRALPDLKITAASGQEDRAVAALKQRIQDAMKLSIGDTATRDKNPLNLRIGARIDGEDLKREMSSIEGLLDQFTERFSKHELVLPLDKARQQAVGFVNDIKTQEDRANEQAAADYLKSWDAAIAERARREQKAREQVAADVARALEATQARAEQMFRRTTAGETTQRAAAAGDRIVDLPVHLQANGLDREMAAIRARLKAMGDVRIGVDVDAETFASNVRREFDRLKEITKDKRVDIEVRADAARAATELGGVLVLLKRIDHDKATVTVDTDGAVASLMSLASGLSLDLGRLGGLIAAGASIGTALVPAAAAAADAIGAIGTAGLAAGAGVSVVALAFSGIGNAVKALGNYADNTKKSSVSLKRAANQVDAAQQQIRGAEMSLANTRRNNAEAALKAQQSIRDALRDEKDATVDVARANRDAVQKVADAEHDVTSAKQDDLDAQQKLNEAYVEARRSLADLNSQLRGNALDQRQATLDIAKAKDELDKMLSNPRASEAEREQADITYQQRLLQMDDLKRKGAQQADEQDKRFREGINQSDEVKAARKALTAADDKQLKAQRALTDAQRDRVRTQRDGTEKLLKAEQKVADARRSAADQQKDAAFSEFTATQSLISARRALENATNRDSVAGGSQLDALNTAMGKLSPTARRFARFVFGMRDAFFALRAAADPVLAGIQSAAEKFLGSTSASAERNLRPLFDFVHSVATALSGTVQRFGALLRGPTFTRFFEYIRSTAVPTLELLYQMFENITVGVINLFLAFTPLTANVNEGLLGLTASFRAWSEGLAQNQGFQKFLDYLRKAGPQVAHLLGAVSTAVVHLVTAAAPVGTVVVALFTKLIEAIDRIPQKSLNSLVAGITAAAAAIGAFAAATAIANLSTAGLAAGGVALLVVALSGLAGINPAVSETLKVVAQLVTAILGLVAVVRLVALVQKAWGALTGWLVAKQELLTASVLEYKAANAGAVDSTGLLNGALFRTASAGEGATGALGGLAGVAGPLAIVVAGLAAIWGVNEWHMKKANDAVDDLDGALQELMQTAKDSAGSATGIGQVDDAFRRLTGSNGDMKQLAETLRGLGLNVDTITQAMSGNRQAVDAATAALNAQAKVLGDQMHTHFFDIFDNEKRSQEQERLWKLADALKGVADKADKAVVSGTVLNTSQSQLLTGTLRLTPAQQALADAQKVLADDTSTAQQRMDALKAAMDAQRQAATDAIDATEEFSSALLALKDGVAQARQEHDKHAASLGLDTAAGLRNRDALEALIQSANKSYDADVALNGVTQKAVDAGKAHMDQIRATAKALGLNKDQTEKLIKAYNSIPTTVETAIGIKAGQFDKLFNQLSEAKFIQDALAKNWSVAKARAAWSAQKFFARGQQGPVFIPAHATGGPIAGPGTKTSDSVLMWGSRGEFMQPAHAVDYYGAGTMEAIRRKKIPREWLQGYATGGPIQAPQWRFPVDVSNTFVPTIEQLGQQATGRLGTMLGRIGWRWQEQVLREAFGNKVTFTSTTGGGHAADSWHFKGRALDSVGPDMMAIFQWIKSHYGATSKELIYSPAVTGIKNGQRVNIRDFYGNSVYNEHFNHVHWAYDKGGLIPDTRQMPGRVMQVFHGSRTPDRVLTDGQWRSMATLAEQVRVNSVGGDTHNWNFRDTTLDESKMAANQARRDALNRVNRRNY